MTKIRRISILEGVLSLLIIPVFIVAAITSFVWLQQTAEGWEGLLVLLYIYSWIFFGICAIPLLISAIGLMVAKQRGFLALSILGIVAKVAACFVMYTFGAQAVTDTPSGYPYVVLIAYMLFTVVHSIIACVKRTKAKAATIYEPLVAESVADEAEETAVPQEDYKN